MFSLDCALEALDKGVVGGLATPVAANAAARHQQGLLKGGAGELTTLVRVKNVGRGCLAQRGGQRLQAKAHVERITQFPAQYVARVPVEHGRQIEKALGHGDIGDVRAPYFIRSRGWPLT